METSVYSSTIFHLIFFLFQNFLLFSNPTSTDFTTKLKQVLKSQKSSILAELCVTQGHQAYPTSYKLLLLLQNKIRLHTLPNSKPAISLPVCKKKVKICLQFSKKDAILCQSTEVVPGRHTGSHSTSAESHHLWLGCLVFYLDKKPSLKSSFSGVFRREGVQFHTATQCNTESGKTLQIL